MARGVVSPVVSLFPAIGDTVPGTFRCFRGTLQGITRLVVFGPLLKIERAVASQQLPVRPLVSSDSPRSVYPSRHSQPPFLIAIAIGGWSSCEQVLLSNLLLFQILISFDPLPGAPHPTNLNLPIS